MKAFTRRLTTVLLAIPAAGILAQQNHPQTDMPLPSGNPAWSAAAESMHKMHAAMAAAASSGDADIDFVSLMLPHHQGAMDMARIELQYGKDPQMRRLAQEIVADQQSEIELMNLWLQNHTQNSLKEKPAAAIRAGQDR